MDQPTSPQEQQGCSPAEASLPKSKAMPQPRPLVKRAPLPPARAPPARIIRTAAASEVQRLRAKYDDDVQELKA